MNTLDRFSKCVTGFQSKKGLFSREPALLSVSLMETGHHTCHPVSLCTKRLVFSGPVEIQDSRLLYYLIREQNYNLAEH